MSEADFKTLRSHGPCCVNQEHRVDAYQALGNIEAEVERLQTELDETAQLADRLAKGYNAKHDEVERLREQVTNYEFWIAAWPTDAKPEDYDRLRRIEEAAKNTPCLMPVETEGNADCGICYVCVRVRPLFRAALADQPTEEKT